MQISGCNALVTGGASGLGAAVAQKLIEKGARVLSFDLAPPQTSMDDRQLEFFKGDVSNSDSVSAALVKIEQEWGGLHFAINCAGIAFAIRTLQKEIPADLEHFEMTLKVNLIGTFNVSRLAAASMVKNKPNADGERGVIVNTASIAAFEGQMGQVAYAASKGGIVAMTLPMARDLAKVGIRVLTLAPGIFDTPLLAKLPEAARISLAEQVPFPSRLGRPREFAQLVESILENPMLNGETIRIDGALRMNVR